MEAVQILRQLPDDANRVASALELCLDWVEGCTDVTSRVEAVEGLLEAGMAPMLQYVLTRHGEDAAIQSHAKALTEVLFSSDGKGTTPPSPDRLHGTPHLFSHAAAIFPVFFQVGVVRFILTSMLPSPCLPPLSLSRSLCLSVARSRPLRAHARSPRARNGQSGCRRRRIRGGVGGVRHKHSNGRFRATQPGGAVGSPRGVAVEFEGLQGVHGRHGLHPLPGQ